jgi:hypothetical protein
MSRPVGVASLDYGTGGRVPQPAPGQLRKRGRVRKLGCWEADCPLIGAQN